MASDTSRPAAVLIPVKLDAFVLNEAVCNSGKAFIAPFSRPDYAGLEPGPGLKHDVVPHLDLHAASPASVNTRLTSLDTGKPRIDRLGVYLHWTLPKPFRAGFTAGRTSSEWHDKQRAKKGLPPGHNSRPPSENTDSSSLDFCGVPDRWIIIRWINAFSGEDVGQPPHAETVHLDSPFAAFVLESNRIRMIDQEELKFLDLETEAANFIQHKNGSADIQTGVFLGAKYNLREWQGTRDPCLEEPNNFHNPLTIADSSNALFADFQHHSTNVFAIHDDMTYYSLPDNKRKTLSAAQASYLVLGYYGKDDHDPLRISTAGTNQELLSTHYMKLEIDNQAWLNQPSKNRRVRSLCMGAVDGVKWSSRDMPSKVPADDAATVFRKSQPVAIGADLIDALSAVFEFPAEGFPSNPTLANAFRYLEVLAENPNDSGHAESKSTQSLDKNFKPAHGGHIWQFKRDTNVKDSSANKVARPTAEEMRLLHDVNVAQRLLDAAIRQLHYYQQLLFCEWWRSRAAGHGDADSAEQIHDDGGGFGLETMYSWHTAHLKERQDRFRAILKQLLKLATPGEGMVPKLTAYIVKQQQGKLTWKKTTADRFFIHKDPTVMFMGFESGWPEDFEKTVSVRLSTEISSGDAAKIPTDYLQQTNALVEQFSRFPQWLAPCAEDVFRNWLPGLVWNQAPTGIWKSCKWNDSQAWFPLFIEWEVEYFHVAYKHWDLEDAPNGSVRYAVRRSEQSDLAMLESSARRSRRIPGRSSIFPEASRTIVAQINNILKRSSTEDVNAMLSDDKQKSILETAGAMKNVLSAKLQGLTDHLLTLARGAHAIPSKVNKTASYFWLKELMPELEVSQQATVMSFLEPGDKTETTPYTRMAVEGVSRSDKDGVIPLFHAATHGQCRFTKLNIVDKFGQVVCAFNPKRGYAFEPLYPSVSDGMACQRNSVQDRPYANTVVSEPQGRSQFFQLGPRINQNARFNAAFLVRGDRSNMLESSMHWYHPVWQKMQDNKAELSRWRPLLEWENPIWGWLVCNFRNSSLQIFECDGTPRGELLIRKNEKGQWLSSSAEASMNPPKGSSDQSSPELEDLMKKLSESEYLDATWDMLCDASEHINHAPSSFADILPALVGRPLALVTMGWSLELAHQPFEDQSDGDAASNGSIFDYEFQVKLGDRRSLHDGLVGYFREDTGPEGQGGGHTSSFDFKTVYTTYGLPVTNKPGNPLKDSRRQLPVFKPYFIDATQHSTERASDFSVKHNQQFQAFASIIDPFQAVHAYSGVLPTMGLSVAPWTLDDALRRITTFYRAGPLLVPGDLPREDVNPPAPQDLPKLPVDSPAQGNWTWLQPSRKDGQEGVQNREFVLAAADRKLFPPDGPQTAVEGYMKMGAAAAQ